VLAKQKASPADYWLMLERAVDDVFVVELAGFDVADLLARVVTG